MEQLERFSWTGQDYIMGDDYRGTWVDIPAPDGGATVCAGYNGMDLDPNGPYIEVDFTTWGDYVGGTVERSNHRSLMRDYPDTFIDVLYGFGGHKLVIHQDAITDEIKEIFASIDDNIYYDDEDLSMLESEIEYESWESYLEWDVTHDLEDSGIETDVIDGEELKERYYDLTYEQAHGPEPQDAVSMTFPFHEKVVQELIEYYSAYYSPENVALRAEKARVQEAIAKGQLTLGV